MLPDHLTIVLFDQNSFLGGGQSVLLSIAEAACRVAERVVLVVPTGGALEIALERRFGSRVEIVHTPEPHMTHGRKGLRDLVRLAVQSVGIVIRHWQLVRQSDLVYANGARQFSGLMLLSILTGRPCCYHVHINHSNIEKRLIGLAARLPTTHCVIVNSPFVLRRLFKAIPALNNNPRVVLVENGMDRIYGGRIFIDRFSGSRFGTLNVAVLGVLRPEKGQDYAVELARRDSRIHVHLVGRVGEGAEGWAKQLEAAAPPNVTFYEAVSDVPAMLDRLGVHVNLVPSRWEEPFGLVAIEGMACSCITIVSSSGSLPDIAAKTGAIVYRDAGDMGEAFNHLVSEPTEKLVELAKHQFEATMAFYSTDRFLAEIEHLFALGLGPVGCPKKSKRIDREDTKKGK